VCEAFDDPHLHLKSLSCSSPTSWGSLQQPPSSPGRSRNMRDATSTSIGSSCGGRSTGLRVGQDEDARGRNICRHCRSGTIAWASGRSRERAGIRVLSDASPPKRFFTDGVDRLSEELPNAGTTSTCSHGGVARSHPGQDWQGPSHNSLNPTALSLAFRHPSLVSFASASLRRAAG
jgi:hypothetical protein